MDQILRALRKRARHILGTSDQHQSGASRHTRLRCPRRPRSIPHGVAMLMIFWRDKSSSCKQMYAQGKITQQQLNDALAYKIVFQPQSQGDIKAPHFVMAVENYLVQKYGEDMVDNGGLRVITTLNWTLQQQAETAVTQGVARNTQLYKAYNGALVAEDPTTGQILAHGWLCKLFCNIFAASRLHAVRQL